MRLNLEVSNSQMKSFKTLQQRTGASSMKDLINHSLSMLQWAADETAKGNEIAAVNEEQSAYRVLVTPLLQHVRQEREREREAAAVGV